MNGVHDMGGMHGMGPIQYERNEPVFHAPWEGRVFALNRAVGAWGKWTIDAFRYAERAHSGGRISSDELLRAMATPLIELMVKSGLVTRAEVESGKPARRLDRRPLPRSLRMRCRRIVANGEPRAETYAVAARLQGGPARTRPQHQSDRAYATAALRARQAWHDPSRPWRLRLPGHQRHFPWREAAAPLLGALRRARIVGRASLIARYRVCRHVGRLP